MSSFGRRPEEGAATAPKIDADVATTLAFEDRVRAWEDEFLAEHATRSYPAERAVAEPDSPLRTPFQRDRDRIVHSKSFRRLKHKTQVFVAPEGDHYRTRLSHTLEACGIARTVARALGLNEDLTEAIGLGHDLGHPPFGHAGEETLDRCLRERAGARLQAQRALAAGGRGAGARRRRPQPHRAGPRRHPQPHRPGQAGDAGGADRPPRRPRRLHQPRHRRRAARRDPPPRGPARGRDRAARPDRLDPHRHPGRRHRRAVARRSPTSASPRRSGWRCCGCASSCSTASTSARRRAASTPGSSAR